MNDGPFTLFCALYATGAFIALAGAFAMPSEHARNTGAIARRGAAIAAFGFALQIMSVLGYVPFYMMHATATHPDRMSATPPLPAETLHRITRAG